MRASRCWRSLPACLALLLVLVASVARAQLPETPTVVHGDVKISTTGSDMTVQQDTKFGIVNWNSFNVGAGQGVHFANGSGATLNRVLGLTASQIDGTLTATGSLYLLNKNGIIIGADGRVLTGGNFVASTRDITDADFLNGGGFSLFGENTAGVTNLGKISSLGGDVLLAGYTVQNSGTIDAAAGRIGLVAGQRIDVLTDVSWMNGAYAVSLGERGNDVTTSGRLQSLVAELRTHNGNIYALAGNNDGLIQATGVKNEGGKVILTAENGTVQSSGTIVASRDANGGDIEIAADTIENFGGTQDVSGATGGTLRVQGGSVTTDTEMLARGTAGTGGAITIDATREILLTAAGNIDASGKTSGGAVTLATGSGSNLLSGTVTADSSAGTGGTVNLLGDRIALFGATVSASGATGGGKIHVGGGYQGARVDGRANASSTYLSDKTTLAADATGTSGHGGKVVAWADGTTQFAGKITARGGFESGNGGTVETSGLEGLGVSGTVDAGARSANGSDGQWLLDPKNITIGSLNDSISEFQSITSNLGGTPADTSVDDNYFGQYLDLSGETLVVGSERTNAAYVFESGQIAARLTSNSSYGPTAYFGRGVQVADNIVAVWTPNEGKAYIFAKGTGWRNGSVNQTAALSAPSGSSFEFARPNAAATDNARFKLDAVGGGYMLYAGDPGAPFQFSFSNVGAVYYSFINSNGTASGFWGEYRPTTIVSDAKFGHAIEPAGSLLYVTYGGNSQSDDLTIIDRTQSQVRDFPNLLPNAFSLNGLGMAAQGSTLFIPGRSSTVEMLRFSEPGNNVPVTYLGTTGLSLNSPIGARSIAVSGDTLVIGDSYWNNFSGAFAVFQQPASGWASASSLAPVLSRTVAVSAPSGNYAAGVGASLAISGDYLVVGVPGTDFNSRRDSGTVLQFRRTGGVWTEGASLNAAESYGSSNFGSSLDLEGNTWVIGDYAYGSQTGRGHGRAYIYENGQLAATLSGTSDMNLLGLGLGYRVAVSGNRVLAMGAGTDSGGSVYNRINVYEKGTGWRNGTANYSTAAFSYPHPTNNTINGLIATSLAFDGDYFAFGRPNYLGAYAEQKGTVEVFKINGTSVTYDSIFSSPINVGANRDYFGVSVALSGNTLAVGAASFDPAFAAPEYIHLYERSGSTWSGVAPTSISVATVTGGATNERGLGGDLALDGNLLVAGYGIRDVAGSRGVYVFERNGTWAASTTPTARLSHPELDPTNPGYFGAFVAADGDTVAVMGNRSPTTNTASAYIYQRQGDWRDGTANYVATFRTTKPTALGLGAPLALDGNTLLMAGSALGGFSATPIPVSEFRGPFDFTSRVTFASGPGANLNISAAALTNSLSLGTSITLQANNDISLLQALLVNNPNGNGGNLTLQAGRRILVNAPITTDNGNLTLIAGDPRANATYRDAGEKVVVLGRDANNAGVTLNLGTGNLLINAADRFENRTGSTNPFRFDAINPGRWLVFATTPDQTGAPDATNLTADLATVGRDWVYYNKSFDVANLTPSWLPAGDGFIYSVQPSLQVGVGNASITYGQTATASLSLTGLTLGGNAISGTLFGISSADLANLVTTGFAPSVTLSTGGFANAGTYAGGITATAKANVVAGSVFGVAVSTGAAGNLTVAKATLNVAPNNAARIYGDANPTFTATYSGLVAGDTLADIDTKPTIATTAVSNSDVGTYTITGSGGLDNNYLFNFTGTGLLTITARDLLLSGLVGADRTYDGTTTAGVTGTATINPLAGDNVSLAGLLTATATYADRNVGNDIAITLSGITLNGTDATNYNLILPTNLTGDIAPATINITGIAAQNRTYDGSTGATLTGTATITAIGTDQISLAGTGAGEFTDKTVGANKTVTVTGFTLTGTDANNYRLATPTLTAAVTPLNLDLVGLVAQSRTYNATTVATLTGTPTIAPIAGDDVSVSGTATGAFANKNAGTAKPVTITGLLLVGLDAHNYTLVYPVLFADIARAPLTITGLTGVNRTYDGTADANYSGVPTVTPFAGDSVTTTGSGTAAFADKNAGTAKAVTITGFDIGGFDAANYYAVQPTGLTATIFPRAITVSGLTVAQKDYDATTSIVTSGTPSFGGIVAGDDANFLLSSPVFTFTTANAGSDKTISVAGVSLSGADAANYDTTLISNLRGSISPARLSITGINVASRIYDGTATAALTGGTLTGVVGSDVITLNTAGAIGAFADKNAGTNKAVSASGYTISGAAAANYTLLAPTGLNADITPFTLHLLGLNGDKVYDGLASTTFTFTGLDAVFAGDLVTVDSSAVTAAYADKNAGTAKAITTTGLFGLTGTDARNYTLTQPAPITGNIARRGITVSGLTIADKIYDGTTTGVISGTGSFGGAISGDDLAINVGAVTVTFADKNVGTNKAVALSGVTLAGADAGNYTAATPTGITASITAKDLTVTGLAATGKVYDRTTAAALTGTGALVGTVSGDTVSLDESARTGTFADKNVGTAKNVAITGLALNGTDATNYRLVAPSATASITPADATVLGLAALNRVYDATVIAGLSGVATLDFGSLNGVLASAENISLTGTAAGTFANKNVGTGKGVTVSGLSLTGTDATNYTLRLPTTLTANVTPADLQITGAVVASRIYDATTAGTISTQGSVTALSGDTVQLVTSAATATFANKNVGTAKPVTVTGYTLSGLDALNYNLLQPAGVVADITRANLLLTGLVANNKIYDGTTSAPLSGSLTVTPLRTDVVTVTGVPTATFANKNVGTNKAITLTGLSLTGADAANYNIVLPALAANVTARSVTVTGLSAVNRTYDGTTAVALSGAGALSNVVGGDNVGFNLAALSAGLADKNVGVNKLVTLVGNALTGTDAANYQQVLPTNLTATITAKLLAIIGVDAVDRTYDRTTTVALTGGSLSGAIAGDNLSLVTSSASGTTADKNVGTNKAVTVTGYSLTGADASNYTYAQPTGVDVTIAPRQIGVAGVEVADKLFDGTTSARISGGTVSGTLTGDDLSLVTTGATAQFETATVGNDKAVLLSGFTLSGGDAGNYALDPNLKITGRILPSLQEITQVVPAEVLRASANEETARRRADLEQLVASQGNQVQVADFSRVVEQATASLPIVSINRAITSIPPAEQDSYTKAYIAAAADADAANNNLIIQSEGFRIASAQQKQTGQELNQTLKALDVERGVRAPLVEQLDRVNTQLAAANQNLAAIADAKRNIADYTQRLAEANRLGRGSEVAEYQRIIDAANAIVATEATTLAQRDALLKEAAASEQRIAENDRRIADLEKQKDGLATKLADLESRLANVQGAMADAKAKAAAAAEKLAAAKSAGEQAYASQAANLEQQRATTEQQVSALKTAANSDLAAKTAGAMVQNDPFVKQFEAKLDSAKQVTAAVGEGLASSLSPSALDYAKSVAAKINTGGVLDSSDQMRDALVKSVPALRDLQAKVDSISQQSRQATSQLDAIIEAKASVAFLTGASKEQIVASERARLNDRLTQLTGGAIDLSKVPTTNAEGKILTQVERVAIAILNKQLGTPQGNATEATTFAAGYKDRLNDAVAQEFGFSPEQALNDPRVLAKEVASRQPFNSDGSIDKEQLAANLKTAASAYVNLNGALKDEAIDQAATQDPTGALNAYKGAEDAARAEFVKSYGAQPEEIALQRINARIDAYKNANSPEELLRVHAASLVPGGEMTIEGATKMFNELKSGKSPDAVAKDMASSLWNGDGQGPGARDQAAQAARTAQAAQAAAITSLEQADKTGLFKASNAVTGAAGEEFAKTFGGSPQDLGIKALEDPAAAANTAKNFAKDVFTTPDGALNAVKGGISTYSNMADATLNAAKQQLDVVAAKLGGPGEAAAFVLKHGITAATEVKDFFQDAASTVTGGLIPKSGPSKAEVEAAVAYAKAQDAVIIAENQKKEDAMLLQMFQAAQDLARAKAEMAAGVVNAKAQVGQFIVAAKQEADQQKTVAVAKEVVAAEITRVVQTGLQEQIQSAESKLTALGNSPEQVKAKAQLWKGDGP